MGLEESLRREIEEKGVLRLKPTFVARNFYPGLNRLGLKNPDAGPRGEYVERWIASCVEADNPIRVENEGLSEVMLESVGATILFRDCLKLLPDLMLGEGYAKSHDKRFGVLTKILDIGYPIPWHVHARKEDAWRYWRMNPKEEAYYFLDHPKALGPIPYSHLAMHPGTEEEEVLELLKRWSDDKVLDLSPAYRLNIGEGFHIPAGVPHALGTALTLEIQEESDVYNILQARYRGEILSKDLMLRGLPNEEAVVKLIDWEVSTDPYFYKKYHIVPEPVENGPEGDGEEIWIYHPRRTRKFCGKQLKVKPHGKVRCVEKAAHAILVWRGEGKIRDLRIAAQHGLDELFIPYPTATEGYLVENTGNDWLIIYKLFGPDVYP